MPRVCTVCVHEERAAIDRAVVGGTACREVAALYRVSADSVERHAAKHLPKTLVDARHAAVTQKRGRACVNGSKSHTPAIAGGNRDGSQPATGVTIDGCPSGGHSPFGLCVWPRRERGVTWRGVERQKPLVASGGEATRGKKKKMTCVVATRSAAA